MQKFDVIIIGAGIAGLSAAYEISKSKKILVVEQEDHAGYHATGRSAAVYAAAYGSENTALYALVRSSWSFFENPPPGFSEYALYEDRGIMFVAGHDHVGGLIKHYEEMKIRNPDAILVHRDFIKRKFPLLQESYCNTAIYDPNVYDLDVSALQEGYLRAIKKSGGQIVTGFQATKIQHIQDQWTISNGTASYQAPILVNAAGPWVDHIAQMAGVEKINIKPLRRSAILVDGPDEKNSNDWTMIVEFEEEFFFKPDAGKLLISPANEDLSAPCDAQAEEIDIALAAYYAEEVLGLPVKKIDHSWAGLRSFVADRGPVIGFDKTKRGFFWLAGQGGFGVQTAPAAGRLAAALISREAIPEDMKSFGLEEVMTSPSRDGVTSAAFQCLEKKLKF
ncbi:hypothetical protein MNBD_ALPHA03-523 [hydrothermal vent metagenome]|uniref:FAD dependent oxidoreductase domain-containing protein n=1 Tax=hydrothermal vent metagenome TaxID=652676 RepID=A0A3B1AZE3_9ZZZZ